MKYLYFFLFYLNFFSQEIPEWIANHIEYSEQTLADINELRQLKVNLNKSSMGQLRTKLYFVPDSILKKAKYQPSLLTNEESEFLSQFWQHFSKVNSEYTLLFSQDLDAYSEMKYNTAREKMNLSGLFYFKNIRLILSHKKRPFEHYEKKPHVLLSYVSSNVKVHYGDIYLKGANHLIHSGNYGNMFYPGQMKSSGLINTDIRFQKSDLSTSSLFGTGFSYRLQNFELIHANGKHDYFSSIKNNRFSSFNSILPLEESKNKTQEKVAYTAINYQSRKHSYQLSHLLLNYERNYLFQNSYVSKEYNNSEYIALAYGFKDDNFHLNTNIAYQYEEALSTDMEASLKAESMTLYSNIFFYDENYINPKSKGIMHGQSLARNNLGYSFALKRNFHKNFKAEFAYLSKKKLKPESKNSFEEKTTKLFSDMTWSMKALQINLFLTGLNLNNLKNKVTYQFSHKSKVTYIFRKRNKSFANQFQFSFYPFFLELAFIETNKHWQIYELGLKNEFLFSHFNSNSKRALLKYKYKSDSFIAELKYRFIWQANKEFIQSDYTIDGPVRNTISCYLKFSL